MPRNTLVFLLFLAVTASLLVGINIGKKIGISQYLAENFPLPTQIISPDASPTIPLAATELSTYTDQACGFSITYKGSYIEQKTENYTSTIITDPANPDNPIVATCQEEIPKPPLTPERIEDIIVDGVSAKLYHDASSRDGTPRDELIVRHPTLNHEIIIAGFGPAFNESVASFKFL